MEARLVRHKRRQETEELTATNRQRYSIHLRVGSKSSY